MIRDLPSEFFRLSNTCTVEGYVLEDEPGRVYVQANYGDDAAEVGVSLPLRPLEARRLGRWLLLAADQAEASLVRGAVREARGE